MHKCPNCKKELALKEKNAFYETYEECSPCKALGVIENPIVLTLKTKLAIVAMGPIIGILSMHASVTPDNTKTVKENYETTNYAESTPSPTKVIPICGQPRTTVALSGRDIVKNEFLEYPDNSQFEYFSVFDARVTCEKDIYTVKDWVKASNAFGVVTKVNYTITMQYNKSLDSFSVINFYFDK